MEAVTVDWMCLSESGSEDEGPAAAGLVGAAALEVPANPVNGSGGSGGMGVSRPRTSGCEASSGVRGSAAGSPGGRRGVLS